MSHRRKQWLSEVLIETWTCTLSCFDEDAKRYLKHEVPFFVGHCALYCETGYRSMSQCTIYVFNYTDP